LSFCFALAIMRFSYTLWLA